MKLPFRFAVAVALFIVATAAPARAQDSREAAVARAMIAAKAHPGLLVAMLRDMPKGGDLHNHLDGSIYAESFVDWAASADACIRLADMVSIAAPCKPAAGVVPADSALHDDVLRGRIIDAWSMRNWSPAIESGHDHFFATFDKFASAEVGRDGDMMAEAARRALAEHVSYLELMDTPNDGAIALGSRAGWHDDLARMRAALKKAGLAKVVADARADYHSMVAKQREIMKCGTANAEPACNVEVRFLYQVLRGFAPEQVYAQILSAFETAAVDSLVVGFNLVMPEDGYVSMRDFSLHMRIIDFLQPFYPDVRISLHAGELAPGLVPPEGLRFHIRESIEKGHASRIGHGVDVMHEDDARALLAEMAKRDVAVEICLTSNDVILGVSGREHPLALYQRYGVPTLLATDDMGVSRSDMTHEYKRAVLDQNLDYLTLKQMARNSIRYAFVQESTKRRLLEQLEEDFAAFERKWGEP